MSALNRIQKLTGEEFEDLVAYYFYKRGYMVETTKSSGDKGIDLFMKKKGDISISAVQCKNQQSKVSQPAIRDFVGSKEYYTCDSGYFITTSNFTRQAREFGENSVGIKLINGSSFKKRLERNVDANQLIKKASSNRTFKDRGLEAQVLGDVARDRRLNKEPKLLLTSSSDSHVEVLGPSNNNFTLNSWSIQKNLLDASYAFLGEVEYSGEKPAEVSVSMDFYGQDGRITDSVEAPVDSLNLLTGMKSPFRLETRKEFKINKVDISIDAKRPRRLLMDNVTITQFSITQSNFQPSTSIMDFPKIVGKVKNTNKFDVKITAEIIITLYDHDQCIVYNDFTYSRKDRFPAGGSSTFQAEFSYEEIAIEEVPDYSIFMKPEFIKSVS